MKRGDVILVDWSFSDRTGSKLRPAVVVQADFLNGMIDDSVLVAITSHLRVASTEVRLDPAVETASGLKYPSMASCHNLLTIDQVLIHRIIGALTSPAMSMIDDALRVAL